MQITSRVAGIPCLINVLYFDIKPPDRRAIYSDWDYEGWTDLEWEVRDQRGRPAPWLQRKLTADDSVRIDKEILKEYRA